MDAGDSEQLAFSGRTKNVTLRRPTATAATARAPGYSHPDFYDTYWCSADSMRISHTATPTRLPPGTAGPGDAYRPSHGDAVQAASQCLGPDGRRPRRRGQGIVGLLVAGPPAGEPLAAAARQAGPGPADSDSESDRDRPSHIMSRLRLPQWHRQVMPPLSRQRLGHPGADRRAGRGRAGAIVTVTSYHRGPSR